MKLDFMLPVRVAQGVFAFVIIVLSSYVAHWYDAEILIASPSQVNFLIFLPLFSMISIAYLVLAPILMPRASHPFVHLAVEAVNTLFYFAGFIALAVFISKLVFCRGTVCGAARAASAFAGFSWLLWTGTTALVILKMMKGGPSKSNNEKANHPMSQSPLPPHP
ncbi:Uncharacterized protein BP5553_02611 [Venustampulla echinocandica]|uniref:MARVEL domain-containing protein n=1 Tax=Venustampulla echinocandica TaxID=2656787 RepID=A0A370TRY2_9HELO|nr:Uncharacterized protein BP5553_02611 [Venustampulla echinocandica]RDL38271.1 Uncharacterized protein BP5553_02611 [Venustampulla echinocandica]